MRRSASTSPSASTCPPGGFDAGEDTFVQAPDDGTDVEIKVDPASDRIQLLEPFEPWSGDDFLGLPVAVKAQGKCTTDHISMAGPWLKYRGHLENISGNLYLGAVNAFTGEAGTGKDPIDGDRRSRSPRSASSLHEAGQAWVAVGDENYGEGSSREHAAMEPRFRNCAAVFARSFARIAETNLKKQGVLALTFADPAAYDLIGEDDTLDIVGLADLAPDQPVTVPDRTSPTARSTSSRPPTPCRPSRSSGSRPGRPSTSSASGAAATTHEPPDGPPHHRGRRIHRVTTGGDARRSGRRP